eukprot:6674288-Prymnesium_polylepis.1
MPTFRQAAELLIAAEHLEELDQPERSDRRFVARLRADGVRCADGQPVYKNASAHKRAWCSSGGARRRVTLCGLRAVTSHRCGTGLAARTW